MVSRIILLFTLGLMASMTLPATATPHSQVKPREFNSDNITPASSSILVLNTTGASILSAIVDSGAGYAYFGTSARSEEHTSELQSHHDLVCRLLLEKKKKTQTQTKT